MHEFVFEWTQIGLDLGTLSTCVGTASTSLAFGLVCNCTDSEGTN